MARKLRSSSRSFAALAILSVSCGDPDATCQVTASQEALTNAAVHADYLGLEAREEASIVRVTFDFAQGALQEICSGVLIAEGVVLTAKHCAHSFDPIAISVHVEPADDSPPLVSPASIVAAHDELDLLLLSLADAPSDPSLVATLPLAPVVPSSLHEGSLVQVAGFGTDEEGVMGHRGFLVAELLRLDESELLVSAGGLGGACFGDSGGPLVVRADDGTARTLGILSSGAANCFGEDRYTRVDIVAEWIATSAGVDVTEPASGSHAALGNRGRCFGDMSVWVDGESLTAVVCEASAPCGWSEQERGFRCVPTAQDSCRGFDDLGACEDGAAVRCVDGSAERNPCATCGFSCARSPATGRAICVGKGS
jgi:hypothetical protein